MNVRHMLNAAMVSFMYQVLSTTASSDCVWHHFVSQMTSVC